MAHSDDDTRPKLTFSERDKKLREGRRDGGSQGGSGQGRVRPESGAYRAYKSQLEKVFSGQAELPAHLKEQLEEASVGSEAKVRREASQAIVEAQTVKALRAALREHASNWGFPEDEPALTRLLDHPDEDTVLQALQGLHALHQNGGLKRMAALRGRIKSVRILVDAPEVQDAAGALLEAL